MGTTSTGHRRSTAEKCPLNRAAASRLDAAMTKASVSNAALAAAAGVSESLVSYMRRAERHVHGRLIEALPSAAKRAWCESLAASEGARVVQLAGPRKCQPVDYLSALGRVSSEVGDVLTATTVAIADGHVDPDEASVVVRECDEAIDRLLALRERARRAQTTGGERLRAVEGGA